MNTCRKGIILAGGAGSRLWPLTVVSTKQLLPPSSFIRSKSVRGLKIGCPEEVAYRMGFIDAPMLQRLVGPIADSDYGAYLSRILNSPP